MEISCIEGKGFRIPIVNTLLCRPTENLRGKNLNIFDFSHIQGLLEQITYTPAAMTSFYFFMSLMEGKSVDDSIAEVQSKFLPTYKVRSILVYTLSEKSQICHSFAIFPHKFSLIKAAMCVWPMVSTVNFALVPEKNRVVFISMCSLIWTCFLAYVKQLDQKNVDKIYSNE